MTDPGRASTERAGTTERTDSTATTGIASLDDQLGGGLVVGDNVVWLADEPTLVARICRRFAAHDPATAAWVTFTDLPPLPAGVEVVELDPADTIGDASSVVAAITGLAPRHPRLVVDGLDVIVEHAGAGAAVDLYRRTCPRLFDQRAVAYWPSTTGVLPASAVTDVRRVAQCVFEVRATPDADGATGAVATLRVVKAEGRSPSYEGALAEVRVDPDTGDPVIGKELVVGRLSEGLRRVRRERNLTQKQLAAVAGVTPAAISQAEAGRRGLSLETLIALCDRLGIAIDDVVGRRDGARHVLARRDRHPLGGGTTALLDDPDLGTRVYRAEVEPSATGAPPFLHKGVELVLVARGLVMVDLGEDTPVMRAGDALRATTEPVRSWTNLGPDTAELFWIAEPLGPAPRGNGHDTERSGKR